MILEKIQHLPKSVITGFYVAMCIILAGINLYFKLYLTPAWFNGILDQNHALLLDFNFYNNEQSRLFQFLIPELICRISGLSVPQAYAIQRFVFTALTFVLFFYFAKKWMASPLAFLCVLAMAMLMPFTYRNHLQESAALMSLTFLLGLWAIRENKDLWFTLVLVIGAINNETMLFMPMIYFLFGFENWKLKSLWKLSWRTLGVAFPAFLAVGIIRYINMDRPHLGGAFHLFENFGNLDTLFMAFHVFWVLPLLTYKLLPLFLQRAYLSIPFFVIPHLITGAITETRQMVPLSFILLPASAYILLLGWKMLKPKLNSKKTPYVEMEKWTTYLFKG